MSTSSARMEQAVSMEGEVNSALVSGGAQDTAALSVADTAPPNSDRVLWDMDGIRDLFNKRRMWPTFVGPKFIQNGTTKITLPVLVWKEQQQYCMETSLQPGAAGTLKRKRAESTAETVPSSSSSKPATAADTTTSVSTSAGDHAHYIPPSSSSISNSSGGSTTEAAAQLTPLSAEERTRCRIFADLHDQGYFVGPADAYGGDFSLYKGGGDPTQTHSIATVRVVSRGHKITARELLAFSRVQNQVAKSAVLAFSLPTTTAKCNSAAAATNSTGTNVSTVDSTQSVMASSSSEKTEDRISGEKNGVGYIVINFRNVSDRM